ncbi:AMP-binding protein [Mesorhizobium sp.]|uniref:AMP-binding protein n=1 Tax=Mesorhizobium sp. TaxID=1871066 RepID=UPI001218164E|nr:AMP-binding protein [Mesorhizobium sp.]TIO65360.1 MAG: long-chain fatty acid--CoA ligase [Mesorhizobium sp.]
MRPRTHRPAAPILDQQGTPLTFNQVNCTVNRLAHGIAAAGIKKGDKAVLLMPNRLEFVLLWFRTDED